MAQWKEARGVHPRVTCLCDRVILIRFMFRCLYCGLWFCQPCAEVHFGKTREQWRAENKDAAAWRA